MPGMTSAPRKGRRDFEPANCLNETGADCQSVRAQGIAFGWAATVMSPCGVVICKVTGPRGPLLTNRMTELVTYGSVGGGGSNPAPYPAGNAGIALQLTIASHRPGVPEPGAITLFMIKSRHILGASLIISWGLLISTHCICITIIFASPKNFLDPTGAYSQLIGHWLPALGWVAFVIGLVLFVVPSKGCNSPNDGDKKNAA
jgi:hypothetical protein